MAKAQHSYTIRLDVDGGGKVKAVLTDVGASGEKSLKKMTASSKALTNSFDGIYKTLITRLVPAFAGLRLSRSIFDNIQTFERLDIRLRTLTQSAEDYAQVQEYLKEKADSLNVGLATLTDGYAKLLVLQNSGILDRGAVNQLSEGLVNAAAALGASESQIDTVLYGLAQGLSAGTLRAEELNQVVEPLPGLLQELDKAAGVASGGFRQMVNDGSVTSEFFRDVLIRALESYEGAAAKMSDTSVGALTRLNNSWVDLSRSLGEGGVTDVLVRIVEALTDVNDGILNGVKNNKDYAESASDLGAVVYSLTSGFVNFVDAISDVNIQLVEFNARALEYFGIIDKSAVPNFTPNFTKVSFQKDNPFTDIAAYNKNLQESVSKIQSAAAKGQDGYLTIDGIKFKNQPLSAPSAKPKDKTTGKKGVDPQAAALKIEQARAEKISDIINGLKAESQELETQIRLFGQKDATVARALEQLKIENKLKDEGIILSAAQAQEMDRTLAQIEKQKTAYDELSKQQERLAEQEKNRRQALDQLGATFSSAFEDAIIEGKKFSDVLAGIGDDIQRLLLRQLIVEPFSNALSGAVSGSGFLNNIFPFAGGGVMTNAGPLPLHTYAMGGIANSPQLALYGERMPEAYVPLPDGRTIPVTMTAPANSGSGVVNVIVNNNSSAQVGVQERQNASGGKDIILQLDDMNGQLLSTPGSKTRKGINNILSQGIIKR